MIFSLYNDVTGSFYNQIFASSTRECQRQCCALDDAPFAPQGDARGHNAAAPPGAGEPAWSPAAGSSAIPRDGILLGIWHADTHALHAAVARLTSTDALDPTVIRLGSVPVIVARAAPGRALDTPASGAALVYVKDNDARLSPPDALLAAEFGLTRAEARIASPLAGGESLQNIADTQGVSIHTVRSLLKRAMAKAEASSQAQLVAKALSGVARFPA